MELFVVDDPDEKRVRAFIECASVRYAVLRFLVWM